MENNGPVRPEMAESASSPLLPTTNQQQAQSTASAHRSPSSASGIPTKKAVAPTSTSTSHTATPSRETSPIRPSAKTNVASRTAGRARKNNTDPSPTRPANASKSNRSSITGPARTLGDTTIPHIQPSISTPDIEAPTPQKPTVLRETPRWPVSPRLRSPPPVIKPLTTVRKGDQDVPAINLQKATPTTDVAHSGSEEDSAPTMSVRAPPRTLTATNSTLETVQEYSLPGTPAKGLDGTQQVPPHIGLQQAAEQTNVMDQAFARSMEKKESTSAHESGSDSGGNKSEAKIRAASVAVTSSVAPTPVLNTTKSFSTGTTTVVRAKAPGEGSAKNMTVETETVSSIPQVAVGGGAGAGGGSGTLRAKPSSETIRPKKEKKKTARKAPSITSGTASSKADIFEAKIASAVDQADSSDSEETFVYESNPPDKNNQPRRFHSRTPSATSMTSQAEHNRNSRSIHGVMDAFQGVSMKKSMKFTNTHNSNTPDHGTEDDGKGTVRSHVGTGRGTTHHHHIGRWGRQNGAGGNGHPSLFDNESPFPNATRQSKAVNTSRNSSRPHSPRFAHNKTPNGKRDALLSSGYDDDGTRADDERAPLLSSTVRSNRRRRQPLTMRQLEHQDSMQHKSFLGRFAGCLVLSVMILLIASGGLGLWLATTQPLTGIEVKGLKNIIATEQELMVDMQVLGRNPNIVAVTVESIDVEIFAKSKHAGTDSEYWKRPTQDDIRPYDDDPRDPPHYDDPSSTATMRLGNVSAFFSPLTFDPSPLSYKPTLTTGQIRLARPGNSSADGGSERWERILKYEFELVVNGVLKYQLPLSQRIRRVEVVARQRVEPDREGVVPPDEGGEGQGVHIAMD